MAEKLLSLVTGLQVMQDGLDVPADRLLFPYLQGNPRKKAEEKTYA